MANVIVVLDIGKSNVKLSVIDTQSAEVLSTEKRTNSVLNEGIYPHMDIEGIWDWYCKGLSDIASEHYVCSLGCTTHGATAVCLGEGKVVLPVLDYEFIGCNQNDELYEKVRPVYAETFSPLLDMGLNIGRQLHWLSQTFPESFASIDTILMYPQYWCWRLSGRTVSEVTSLGCHTDLWNPLKNDYSSLLDEMSWRDLFPPLLAAGEKMGKVLPELREALGLPDDCQVINGIHDSNASLVPYLQSNESPFTVISSGTWVVIAGIGAPLEGMSELEDMLVNVNAYGKPVPSIRFMGGREWEQLRGALECDQEDLQRVLHSGVYALPSFASSGPFLGQKGRLIGPVEQLNDRERTALASLYCALVTNYCLERLQAQGPVFLEGSFAKNQVYCSVLNALLVKQELKVSADDTGTTGGVSKLMLDTEVISQNVSVDSLRNIEDLRQYSETWTAQLRL